jgi:hypothetical protein
MSSTVMWVCAASAGRELDGRPDRSRQQAALPAALAAVAGSHRRQAGGSSRSISKCYAGKPRQSPVRAVESAAPPAGPPRLDRCPSGHLSIRALLDYRQASDRQPEHGTRPRLGTLPVSVYYCCYQSASVRRRQRLAQPPPALCRGEAAAADGRKLSSRRGSRWHHLHPEANFRNDDTKAKTCAGQQRPRPERRGRYLHGRCAAS